MPRPTLCNTQLHTVSDEAHDSETESIEDRDAKLQKMRDRLAVETAEEREAQIAEHKLPKCERWLSHACAFTLTELRLAPHHALHGTSTNWGAPERAPHKRETHA